MKKTKKIRSDLSEAKIGKPEEQIFFLNRALKVLRLCNKEILDARKEKDILDNICDIIVNEGGYKMAWVGYVENDIKKTIKPISWTGFKKSYIDKMKITWAKKYRGMGPTGTAARSLKYEVARDINKQKSYKPWREMALRLSFRSSIALPLVIDGKIFGVLSIYSTSINVFNPSEIEILKILADNLSFGIKIIRENNARIVNEEKLKRSDEFLRNANSIMLRWTPNRKISFINDYGEKIFGYEKGELMGKNVEIFVPRKESTGRDLKFLIKNITSHPQKYLYNENENIKKDGTRFWVSWSNKPILDKKGKLMEIMAVGRDITEIKKYSDKLEESEKRFKNIFNYSAVGVSLVSIDGKWIEVNDAVCKITGYSRNELLNKKFKNITHPDDIEKSIEASKRILSGKAKHANFEKRYINKKGKIVWVSISTALVSDKVGKPLYFVTHTEDITAKKEAENSIKESMYFFKESQKVARIGSYKNIFKTDNWESSETLNKIFGIDKNYRKTIKTWLKIVHPDDRKMMEKYFREEVITKHKQFDKDYRIKRISDGVVRWVSGLGKVSYDKTGKPISMIGTIQDITDRKEEEEKNRWLASFPILNPIPILEITKDKGVTFVNTMAQKMFPDLKKKQMRHPFISNSIKYFKQLNSEKKNTITNEIKINDCWYLQSYILINPEQLRVYAVDITELKNSEKETNEVKNRDEAILNSIGDAVFACDRSGIILQFNKIAEKMTGVDSKKAIGKHYSKVIDFVKESDGKQSNDFISEAIKKNKITEMENHTLLVRKDGTKIQVADAAAPVKNLNGEIIGCVVVFRDVTKERELDRAKIEFLSLTSHQLRTPLSINKWVLEALLHDKNITPKQQERYNDLTYSNERLINLVNNLLSVTRIEAGKLAVSKKNVDLNDLVNNLVDSCRVIAEKRKKIITVISSEKFRDVYCDPLLVHEALENLLSNAINYSSETSREISVSIKDRPDDYLISIHNEGVIDQQSIGRIKKFERFMRGVNASERQPSGSGLGLYITKKIIEATGGTVWFESNTKDGTTFYLTIIKNRGNSKKIK